MHHDFQLTLHENGILLFKGSISIEYHPYNKLFGGNPQLPTSEQQNKGYFLVAVGLFYLHTPLLLITYSITLFFTPFIQQYIQLLDDSTKLVTHMTADSMLKIN